MKRIDLTGLKIGSLTVLRPTEKRTPGKQVLWAVRCDCGSELLRIASALNRAAKVGYSSGCATCLRDESSLRSTMMMTTHGQSKNGRTRLYEKWWSMLQRCYYEKSNRYSSYGAKGITVHDPWHKFVNFRDWANKSGYIEGLTIERVDPKLNYDPSNCEWITKSENSHRARSPGHYWRSMTCDA